MRKLLAVLLVVCALPAWTDANVALAFGQDQPKDEEHQPPPDPFLPVAQHDPEPLEMPVHVQPAERRREPSFIASETCGVVVFAAGLGGWIALGIAVLILERKHTKPT